MPDIRVPKLNNNDDQYTLIEWIVADGRPVQPDDAVATVETSKTAEELVCAEPGILHHVMPVGSQCSPGDVIGHVAALGSPDFDEPTGHARPLPATVSRSDDDGPVVTRPAQALIKQLGVDPEAVRTLGVKIVRAADVQRLAAARDDHAQAYTPPPAQQAVAKVVVRSHATIPAAYTAVKVDVGAAVEVARRQAKELRRLVGLPELLVAAVAALHPAFPLFFAEPIDESTLRLADEPHVGVTIDVGRGLYVPVVRNAARLTFAELAEALTGFRGAAVSGAFRERDLSGGNITVTLHGDPDITLAIPIVFPGQTCALALAGTQHEVSLDPNGAATTRTVANIGIAYDHRFVNGRDAVLFLQAVKKAVEAPETLIRTTRQA